MNKNYYITTTLPYVNADPHLGFAMEIVEADAVARYHKLLKENVIFNFGTDEHGQKIYQKALEEKKDPQKYTDEYAAKFDNLKKSFNLSYTNFIRTTDTHHIKAAQEFWKRVLKNGDIYKKKYQIKYCVGCELEKTDSELEGGKCPIHPNLEIEQIDEENYFFKFSKYQKQLLDFYKSIPDFVIPDFRFNEIINFVKDGLTDFSISRLKKKMPWGIDIPDDPEQVMYVWFDALINYISTLGWPDDEKKFSDFWGTKDKTNAIQVAGKDNLRQQTAIWQAMLMSAGLPSSKQVFIHGFIIVNGQKISKSLGNSINPYELVDKYGTDAVRYYLLAKINPYEDSDFTIDKFENVYNADLANGLGNLVARVAKLCENININIRAISRTNAGIENKLIFWIPDPDLEKKYSEAIENYQFNDAVSLIWEKIAELDRKINDVKPWEYDKQGRDQKEIENFLQEDAVLWIRDIATLLKPFLPETAETIEKQFAGPKIKSSEPLFPRLK
jgi:methionyl-tRNA synthetase